MKTHEITTSKGEFVADEIDIDELAMFKFFNNPKTFRCGMHLRPMFLLSEATEEDAKLIVDDRIVFQSQFMKDMINAFTDYENNKCAYTSAVDSLHSLLKSKGIDIDNGNWYLFKKV